MNTGLILQAVCVAVISYLLGSVNISILLSRRLEKHDIRESGSGNAGSTNMLRTYGKKYAALTMLGDMLKVAVAIGIAVLIFGRALFQENSALIKSFAGFFCVLGHIFPVYFKFKGGKGVATAGGMVLLIDWRIGLILLAIFIITVAITRWVSLGSIIMAVLYPVLTYAFHRSWLLTLIAVLFAVIVIAKHAENIRRIFRGTENKISFSKSGKENQENDKK